jgi:hypothetical protein
MQVETPHHPPSSWPDFLKQYAMIVLSILTALALEQGVVSWQNRAAAHEAKVRVEAEIAQSLKDLRDVQAHNKVLRDKVHTALLALVAELKLDKPDQGKITTLAQESIKQVGFALPGFSRDAWDTAIADQSASHMDPADLRRYSEIYTGERQTLEGARLLLSGDMLQRLADQGMDVRLGRINGHDFAQTMNLYLTVITIITKTNEELETLIVTGKEPPL